MSSMKTNGAGTSTASPETPKSKFDTLLTSTPVILTVLATLLAGLSSSEMTKAQYHRALAAQDQSKAGDQWALFQAKRIRGTNMDTTADMLSAFAEPGAIELDRLRDDSGRLVIDLERGSSEADAFAKILDKGSGNDPIRRVADEFVKTARSASEKAAAAGKKTTALLGTSEVSVAMEYLTTTKLPKTEDKPIPDAAVREALESVEKKETEDALMRRITDAALVEAIHTANENGKRFDDATEGINRPVDQLAAVIRDEIESAQTFARAADRLRLAATATDTSDSVRKAAENVARIADSVRVTSRSLNADFTAARNRYTARRYGKEASYNRAIAGLYEVEVRKSSWDSDRHRTRSGYFFFGMLAAQAGVTIATLALAVKLRSLLWGLASLAGFAAIVIAVVVYVFV